MKTNTSEIKEPRLMEIFRMYPVLLLVQLTTLMIMAGFGITGMPAVVGSLVFFAILNFLFSNYNPGIAYYRRMGIVYRLLTLFLVFLSIHAIPTEPAETQVRVWGMIALFAAISNLLRRGEEIEEKKWKQILNTLGQHSGWRVV